MVVECAWCGCLLGQKDGLGRSGMTSGICPECYAAICAELEPVDGGAPLARESYGADAEAAVEGAEARTGSRRIASASSRGQGGR